jgi:hypothetical protein
MCGAICGLRQSATGSREIFSIACVSTAYEWGAMVSYVVGRDE